MFNSKEGSQFQNIITNHDYESILQANEVFLELEETVVHPIEHILPVQERL